MKTTTEPDYWFTSINEIICTHRGHWFDDSTRRFFGCRILPTVYGGRWFITSEKDNGVVLSDGKLHAAWNGERRYTIRLAKADGGIETVGEFGQYATRNEAIKAVRPLAHKQIRRMWKPTTYPR